MKLSTSTNICAFSAGPARYPLVFCIEESAKAGFKYLDLNFCEAMNPASRMRDDDWEQYVEELAETGRRCNVIFVQSHLPYYDIFAENDPNKAKMMEELIRRSIIASSRLGVKWTVTHPGTYYRAGQDMSVSLERNLEYYSKHVDTAREYGIGIALENDFEYKSAPYQHIFCANIYEQVNLIDSFNDPEHVGACYDFGHANLVGGFHRQNLNILGKRVKAIHVQDNKGLEDEHLLPFHGNIDWKEAMAGLADIGFEGDLTFEIQEWGRFYPKELKCMMAEYAAKVGNVLISYFNEAVEKKNAAT
ncbi:MAG TPA: sugar phosphate isomerase/epimerase [Clostridiaceae bacterium]|nr:sugar phosphate isomerase/epimerase [Clostridiaceae bacterium]